MTSSSICLHMLILFSPSTYCPSFMFTAFQEMLILKMSRDIIPDVIKYLLAHAHLNFLSHVISLVQIS